MVRLRVAYSYFPRDGLGEILGATVVDVENAAEQAETILARRAAETVEGTARGADRQVDVGFRAERNGREWLFGRRIDRREGSQVRSLHRPPCSPGKPTRFPGRQKPSQFRSVSEACRGLRTEFRPFSRVLRPEIARPRAQTDPPSLNATYQKQRERYIAGLRMAGLPEE